MRAERLSGLVIGLNAKRTTWWPDHAFTHMSNSPWTQNSISVSPYLGNLHKISSIAWCVNFRYSLVSRRCPRAEIGSEPNEASTRVDTARQIGLPYSRGGAWAVTYDLDCRQRYPHNIKITSQRPPQLTGYH
jgi:hypothetical protein